MSEFYTILTNAGLAAIANATVNQKQVNFAKIAVGDGNGAYYTPTQEATALRKQVWVGNVASVTTNPDNANWVVVETVIPGNVGGFEIRELGIFDENNVLLAIGKLPLTYKPNFAEGSSKDLYIKAIFEVTNASAVTLKVDPSVIYASKKYVDDKVTTIVSGLENVQQKLTKHEVDYVKHPGSGVITRTGNNYEVTLDPAPTAYVDLMGVIIKADADVTGQAITLNVNGLGAKSVLTPNGTNPTFKKGSVYALRWNGTAFILQGEGEVNIGKQIITPSNVNQTITKGIHDGTGYVYGSPNLVASNVRKNVNLFGVMGTWEGDLVGFDAYYLNPISAIPKTNPFYTIPMTGGWRIAEFMPNAGPGGTRDYMNGGSYPTMQFRGIGCSPSYGTNGTLIMTVRSSDGRSWNYTFPKGYNIWFPWFTVILSGSSLLLRAYFEYDGPVIGEDYSRRTANAVNIFTTLAGDVKDISSIEFRVDWEYSGVTHTYTNVQGSVYKFK
ncbi:phage tail protein [Lysinibacillus xylanilyticus]|uniref:phage tail protein n=1 Tax=Lysinibacillus xylanilyticus TaxID=582475 RepID=UPI0036DDB197